MRDENTVIIIRQWAAHWYSSLRVPSKVCKVHIPLNSSKGTKERGAGKNNNNNNNNSNNGKKKSIYYSDRASSNYIIHPAYRDAEAKG